VGSCLVAGNGVSGVEELLGTTDSSETSLSIYETTELYSP
jgi:hypothetical protein